MTNGSPGSVVEGLETGGNDLIDPGGKDPDGDPRLIAQVVSRLGLWVY